MIEYAVKVRTNGSIEWWFEGKLHRTDGPAIERTSGHKEWRLEGRLHRTDGPAIEWANGGKSWWVEGKLHRTDGPAVEWADGSKSWYLNGKEFTEEEHRKAVSKGTCAGKVAEIDGIKYTLEEAK